MKRLILVRHGHAIRLIGQTDFEKSLTETGFKEALKAAEFLNSKNIFINALYTSHADRAVETARIIFDQDENIQEIKVKEELYNCSEEVLLGFIKRLKKSIDSVLIVAHNPAITSVITKFHITKGRENLVRALNHEVTCKVVILEIDTNEWSGMENANTNLLDVFYP